MRRRDFIATLGATAMPLAARAQRVERVRRIGVVTSGAADDPQTPDLIAALAQGLQERGWIVGGNVRIDYRWGASNLELRRKIAAELVALKPDVVLVTAASLVEALQEASRRTVPIVFVTTVDPVGSGIVGSLARPGGNATGFLSFEFSMGGKWLELLKEIAPGVTRVAVIRDPTIAAGTGEFAAIQTVASSFRVELTPIGVHDADEIERGLTAFARTPNGGLIMAGPFSSVAPYRELIVTLAARYRLPAVYSVPSFVTAGGLICYAVDIVDQVRRASGYVDRILRGESPADLPVQAPVKFETVLNLKTAKTLGIEVPTATLLRATEVIE